MPQRLQQSAVPKKTSFKQEQLRYREDALVKAAAQLFADKGYERTTIEDVIGVIGISKPTFYAHFASKEVLAIRVVVAGLEAALAQVEAFAATMPPGQAARAMIDWAVDNQAGANGEPSFSGALAFFDHPEVLAAETRLTERLAELINRGQQEGTIRKTVHPRVLSQVFRSVLKDNAFFLGSGTSRPDIAAIKSDLKNLLL
jgi:AcrR family transcriptional regulator